jgi:DNA-binding HxlR family transcriptional regulator
MRCYTVCMTKKGDKVVCPAAHMLTFLGKRHMLLIIFSITSGPIGFNELQDTLGINTATLSNRLNELEVEKIIERKTCESDTRRHYYSLTKRGKAISKLIASFSKI